MPLTIRNLLTYLGKGCSLRQEGPIHCYSVYTSSLISLACYLLAYNSGILVNFSVSTTELQNLVDL